MIKNFGNKCAADVYEKGQSKGLPAKHWQRAADLLDIMEAVTSLEELKAKGFPPSLRLHRLKGRKKAIFAIDIHKTDGWRITFDFESSEFTNVTIEDYH